MAKYFTLLKNMKILVVEDLLDNQLLIKLVLRPTYAQVDIASTGNDGVALATSKSYDAILMDIQMPFMDGHEATRMIRSYGCTTPVIALTANALDEERLKCVASGFNEFITKPLDLMTLLRTLAQYAPQDD